MSKELKKRYEEACEDYLKAFCDAYGEQYEKDSWVAGDVGTIACVRDYFFDFNEVVKYSVDNNLHDWDELMRWYDYTLFASEYKQTIPNWQSWSKGCPRLSETEQAKLISMKRDLEAAINDYKERY